jgi:tetratricopeptide (TPR) repeat protein
MAQALATPAEPLLPSTSNDQPLPPVPWRDPHTVSKTDLAAYIANLEQACRDHPASADLRTCLGMAYAVNYDVYKSMDALEAAVTIDPQHFWAQLKYAELQFRLRALPRAQEETLKAVELARTPWQLSLARAQLRQIRKLLHDSTRNVTWTKPLTTPALVMLGMIAVVFVVMLWK